MKETGWTTKRTEKAPISMQMAPNTYRRVERQFKERKRHLLLVINGDKYEGEFVDGDKHGFGRLYDYDGGEYV